MEKVQIVVLLGGLGTRLMGEEAKFPKAMVDVCAKPFFYYQLQLMKLYGLKNFVFCIGYKGEAIKDFFKDGDKFGVNIKYSSDGKKLVGTGGALRNALPLLKKDFLVIYGDTYLDVDYRELIYIYYKVKKDENKKGLMAIFKNKNQYDRSNVVFKGGKLLKYDKKNILPDMEYIDYGISILNKNVIKDIPKDEFTDLSTLYANLIEKKQMSGYEVKNRFYEIGKPSSLNEFKNFITHRLYLKKPAVFLDRDGTLNKIYFNDDTEQFDSPLKPENIKLLPKTIAALRLIKSLGYLLIVVTNQPAAAKGKATLRRIYEVNNRFKDTLIKNHIYLDDVLICLHHPVGSVSSREPFLIGQCECRKPKTGLLDMAIEKFNIDISRSYMVGDSHIDIITGRSLKIKSVFVGEYKCDTCQFLKEQLPDYRFKNLYAFALYLKNTRENRYE